MLIIEKNTQNESRVNSTEKHTSYHIFIRELCRYVTLRY